MCNSVPVDHRKYIFFVLTDCNDKTSKDSRDKRDDVITVEPQEMNFGQVSYLYIVQH